MCSSFFCTHCMPPHMYNMLARSPGGSFAQRLYVVSICSGYRMLGVIRHSSITLLCLFCSGFRELSDTVQLCLLLWELLPLEYLCNKYTIDDNSNVNMPYFHQLYVSQLYNRPLLKRSSDGILTSNLTKFTPCECNRSGVSLLLQLGWNWVNSQIFKLRSIWL